jgi:hypothetical protein
LRDLDLQSGRVAETFAGRDHVYNDQSGIAISGIVSGNVKKVGFRVMIQKQAIEYNLAGSVENRDDGKSVRFILKSDQSGCSGHS